MNKTYKPNTKSLLTASVIFSFIIYIVLLFIFFILPNYANTYRIYTNPDQIPYYVSMITFLSVGISVMIFGLSYAVAKGLRAEFNENELKFTIKPIIGSEKMFNIQLDQLAYISSRKMIVPAGKTFITTYPLVFKNQENEMLEVPTLGWDNNCLKEILSDIHKMKPEVKIDTVFYKN